MNKSKKIKVGIMGFGRIGRDFYHLAQEHPEIDIVAISDLGNPKILLYLLNLDSVDEEIKLEGNFLISKNSRSRIIQGIEPKDIPWDMLEADIIVDATHKYCSRSQMQGHIDSGAKRVILTALPRDEIDRIVVMGINDHEIDLSDKLISGGSSTTSAFALMLKVLSEKFNLQRVMMTTIHAYTSDQPLHDMVGRDYRRSRSAAENIIPNETSTPKWVESLLPEFKGKLDGLALNIPIPRGSCLDLTLFFKDDSVNKDDINAVLKEAAEKMPHLIGITDDPIVSSDVVGSRLSLLFDTKATMTSEKKIGKTICWYDNGLGHAARIIDIVLAYGKLEEQGGAK